VTSYKIFDVYSSYNVKYFVSVINWRLLDVFFLRSRRTMRHIVLRTSASQGRCAIISYHLCGDSRGR